MALASAGFVALDGGSRERARALAGRAKEAGGAGVELADALLARLGGGEDEARRAEAEVAHREGLAAYDAGRRSRQRRPRGRQRPRGRAGRGRAVASAFAVAGLLVRHRSPRAGGGTLEVGYRGEELAYLARAAQDFAVQEHTLWAGLERPVGKRLATGLQLSGQGSFTGSGRSRPAAPSAAGRRWGSAAAPPRASTSASG
jgi:hypothetical protein